MTDRPSLITWALDMCDHVALRSRDPSTKVGAVIVRPDKTVASVGYDAETTEPVVLYRDAENELAPIWARPLTEWHHQVTASKRRFELLGGANGQ